jgi:hypothetical protein
MNDEKTVGRLHCWLTDDDDVNYAQGSLNSLLGIIEENGVQISQETYFSIYKRLLVENSVKVGNYWIIRLE